MRDLIGNLIVPVLKITGFRFSKDYRYETTRFHTFVYRNVNVVAANIKAGPMKPLTKLKLLLVISALAYALAAHSFA